MSVLELRGAKGQSHRFRHGSEQIFYLFIFFGGGGGANLTKKSENM